jgi:hypothetical protein
MHAPVGALKILRNSLRDRELREVRGFDRPCAKHDEGWHADRGKR